MNIINSLFAIALGFIVSFVYSFAKTLVRGTLHAMVLALPVMWLWNHVVASTWPISQLTLLTTFCLLLLVYLVLTCQPMHTVMVPVDSRQEK